MKHHTTCLVVALVSACVSACGVEVSESISAESGGRIALGDSVLEIPAAALPADTAVSMRFESIGAFVPLADASDDVLTIEPADTELAVPATLTLDLGGPVESGETVVAHHFTEGGWLALETEVLESGIAQTSISELGSYALTRRPGASAAGIAGHLRWNDGTPVREAPVELHQNGARLTDTVTDDDGAFTFTDVAAGEYQLVVSFECELEETVVLTTSVDVDLVLCSF